MATPESETYVRTFARGLRVIEVMGRGEPSQTIGEIASAADLPRSAARRFLMTLGELGFTRTDGKRFWLTPKVLRLGLSYLYTLPYWRQAQTAAEELCAEIGQSCAISVLDEEEIVYVVRMHTRRILSISPSLGSRLPAHAVSMGRVLLAGLDDAALDDYLAKATLKKLTSATLVDRTRLRVEVLKVREQGWAWIDGELDESICGLAVPIRDADGQTVAALNVSLPGGSHTEAKARERFLLQLRRAASKIRGVYG